MDRVRWPDDRVVLAPQPPLQAFVKCASQGLVVALAGGLAFLYFVGNPRIAKIDKYYQDNPPR